MTQQIKYKRVLLKLSGESLMVPIRSASITIPLFKLSAKLPKS